MSSVAVEVVQACKYYGSKKDPLYVLDHLDLTLQKGTIYALLGSSGCGKTTLLNCLVGNKILNSGSIQIFGKKSSARNGITPGLTVGYMPQDNALYQELTIRETMKYFGWIAGMSTQQIETKQRVILKLLMVPDIDIQIKFLSGGEQRRVSFTIVLLYEPKLLILDEPTVGLDALLRESVWQHLIELAKNQGRTILLTTHYIEETKQADRVGLMRNGYIIAEASPRALLSQFRTGTLEDVFLQLSVMQNTNANKRFTLRINDDAAEPLNWDYAPEEVGNSFMLQKLRALMWKQLVVLLRNIPLLIFTITCAALSVALFFLCVGHAPTGITVAVINHEANGTGCESLHCETTRFGCNYMEILKNKFWNMHEYDTEKQAEDLLLSGAIHGYIIIKHNYTLALKNRLENLRATKSWNLNHSSIVVHRDIAIKDIAYYIDQSVVEGFADLVKAYFATCNESSVYMRTPIDWKTPVHGDGITEMTENGGPTYLLMVAFCVAAIVTSCSILIERNEGTFDRIIAMGVRHSEILLSHIVTDLAIIILQLIGYLIVAFVIFGVQIKGSFFLAVLLSLVNGFSGMCCGYAISTLLNSESAALHLISGSMTPAVLLSGTFWPRESMHPVLQGLVWFLPITQSADAMKNILHRGWNLTKPPVYLGFLNCIAWTIIFLAISVIRLRIKRK